MASLFQIFYVSRATAGLDDAHVQSILHASRRHNARLDWFTPGESKHPVFGKVIEGMEVIDAIAKVPTGARGEMDRDVPKTDVVVQKMELVH